VFFFNLFYSQKETNVTKQLFVHGRRWRKETIVCTWSAMEEGTIVCTWSAMEEGTIVCTWSAMEEGNNYM
jgi:hypothetical protein